MGTRIIFSREMAFGEKAFREMAFGEKAFREMAFVFLYFQGVVKKKAKSEIFVFFFFEVYLFGKGLFRESLFKVLGLSFHFWGKPFQGKPFLGK